MYEWRRQWTDSSAGQPGRRPPGREPVIDLAGRDPPAPLGQPQRRMAARLIARPHLADVLRQRLRRPRHHGGHRPPPRRAAPHRLAVPHVADAQPAELRGRRVDREVSHVEHRRLPAAQPPPVDHLEHRRVTERGQPALARRRRRPLDVIVGGVQERLQLGPGQRAPLRPALVLGRVHGGVALVAHLDRPGADLLLALRDPAVPRVAHVPEEDRQRALIRADRRMRPPARRDPLFHLRGRPLPRPGAGERGEPAHQPDPALDQRPAQPPRRLLAAPALQHRLEQRGLGPQRHRAIHQH